MELKRLPIGMDDFSKIRRKNCYYVDKTNLIKELLSNCGDVNLFTRPRRFGKTLNMSMLKSFFEIGTDKSLFDELSIMKEEQLCQEHMGQYPVISISLKDVEGETFKDAKEQLWGVIQDEATRFDYLQESTRLNNRDKQTMMNLSEGKGNLTRSLSTMARILYREHQKKVIVLIDEYDVPLQKANHNGYYDKMISTIRSLFSTTLKTNSYVDFSIITGCLRVSKESIFTGLNNVIMHTIVDEDYDEWFGFTEEEVKEMLRYYQKEDYFDLTKEWYDGYLFGSTHVYNPWDVINWCQQLKNSSNRVPKPETYWANSSENAIIKKFADMTTTSRTQEEIETLLQGKSVSKNIDIQLTYNEMYKKIDNVWSILFMTGYLTFQGEENNGCYELVVPNKEVMMIMKTQIREWFDKKVEESLDEFFIAIDKEDEEGLKSCINKYLDDSISYMDGGTFDGKEAFYHGFVLGLLKKRVDWKTISNREAGDGRFDVITYPIKCTHAIIFEFKYAKEEKDDLKCLAQEALEQIDREGYNKYFDVLALTPRKIVHCGISFRKKNCFVLMKKEYFN